MSFSGPILFYVNISESKLCPGPLVDELNLQEVELELGGGKQVFIFDELVEESNCHDNKINSFFFVYLIIAPVSQKSFLTCDDILNKWTNFDL